MQASGAFDPRRRLQHQLQTGNVPAVKITSPK